MEKDFSVGHFISAAGALISDTARETLLYVLAVGGITAIGVWLGLTEPSDLSFGFGFMISADDDLLSALFDLASFVVSLVAGYWLLTRFLAAQGRDGGGAGRFWHYLAMSILSMIALVVGFLLLIVPGLILLVRWAAAAGFVIDAKEGVTDALAASWRATKGHSWAIFFAGLIIAVCLAILGGAAGILFSFMGAMAGGVVSAFIEAFASAIFLAFGIGVYCQLHDGTEELEEVFA